MIDDLMTQVVILLEEGAAPITLEELPLRSEDEPVRMHRRHAPFVAAAVGLAAVCAVAAGVVASIHSDGPSVRPAALAAEVPDAELPRASADILVYMRVDASDSETAAVRGAIETAPDVSKFAEVSRDAAYQEFAQIFASCPELVGSISPRDLPQYFRVDVIVPGAATNLEDMLRSLRGVDSVTTGAADASVPVDCPAQTPSR